MIHDRLPPAASLAMALASCAACGSRTGLVEFGGAIDAAPIPRDDSAAPDVAPTDAGPTIECRGLTVLVGPMELFGGDGANYVTPSVVAQGADFLVVATRSALGEEHSEARLRRVAVRAGPSASLSVTPHPSALTEASHTWAEIASDGERLGLCYQGDPSGGMRTRLLTFDSALARVFAADIDAPGAGCSGLGYQGGRWLLAWRRQGSPLSHIAEVDDMGRTTLAPTAAPMVAAQAFGTVAATGYGRGRALAVPWGSSGLLSTVDVYFRPTGGRASVSVPAGTTRRPALAPWSFDPRAIALALVDAQDSVLFTVVRDDGTTVLSRQVAPPNTPSGSNAASAPFAARQLLATLAFGDANPLGGRIEVSLLSVTGQATGRTVRLPIARSTPNARPPITLAATARHALVVWSQQESGANALQTVFGALLGCVAE